MMMWVAVPTNKSPVFSKSDKEEEKGFFYWLRYQDSNLNWQNQNL